VSALDPHSHFAADQARTRRLTLKLDVDFTRRVLSGSVTLHLEPAPSEVLDLDAKGLTIHAVRAADGTPVRFEMGEEVPVLGPRLRLHLPPGTAEVTLDYQTSPEAIALQWLDAEQTVGNWHPYLFSQCQAIHARTMVPCQDTPRARVTYAAEITVPEPLSAVMSAGDGGNDAAAMTAVGEAGGWPVAPANAEPEALERAHDVVGHVDDGGLADALDRALATLGAR
jgi:aminopeptidase N